MSQCLTDGGDIPITRSAAQRSMLCFSQLVQSHQQCLRGHDVEASAFKVCLQTTTTPPKLRDDSALQAATVAYHGSNHAFRTRDVRQSSSTWLGLNKSCKHLRSGHNGRSRRLMRHAARRRTRSSWRASRLGSATLRRGSFITFARNGTRRGRASARRRRRRARRGARSKS